jgi:hypothetical protein
MTPEEQGTREVLTRVARVAAMLSNIDAARLPTFKDPRSVYLDLILAGHEIEAAIRIMRKVWWP